MSSETLLSILSVLIWTFDLHHDHIRCIMMIKTVRIGSNITYRLKDVHVNARQLMSSTTKQRLNGREHSPWVRPVVSIDDIRKRCGPIFNDPDLTVVSWVCLFGSFARGQQTEHSDVDILVGYSKEATNDDIYYTGDIRPQLCYALGRKVDCLYLRHGQLLGFIRCLAVLEGKSLYGSEERLAAL